MSNSSLKEENQHLNVVYCPGDGIGIEMGNEIPAHIAQMLKIFNKKKQSDLDINFCFGALGTSALIETGKQIPEPTLALLNSHKWIIKGPTRTPNISDQKEMEAIWKHFQHMHSLIFKEYIGKMSSANVQLRKLLDLYVCRRPIFHLKNVPTKYGWPQVINWTIFRENTEGDYGMPNLTAEQSVELVNILRNSVAFKEIGDALYTDSKFVINLGRTSEHATKRLMREAIEFAIKEGKKIITIVCKYNIKKSSDGAFIDWCQEVAKNEFADYCDVKPRGYKASRWEAEKSPKIIVDNKIADDFLEKMSTRPELFNIIVTKNLEGDYFSDGAAGLIGGLGVAPGVNENLETGKRVYEATHGTADDIAGKNLVNPTSQLLSFHMMFEDMGEIENPVWKKFADFYMAALTQTFENKQMTGDLTRQIDEKMPSLLFTEFLEAIQTNAESILVTQEETVVEA